MVLQSYRGIGSRKSVLPSRLDPDLPPSPRDKEFIEVVITYNGMRKIYYDYINKLIFPVEM